MLTLCPTPIGNLEDVTPRQLRALRDADAIACEDSRTTGKLLEMLGISRSETGKPELISYHEHNAEQRAEALIQRLEQGERITLVSDAGTPTISDPGYRLVKRCHEQGITISALPGPVAAVVALSASGLPSNRFFFEGFLPGKDAAKRQRLEALRHLGVTSIIYESPHKLLKTLRHMIQVFGEAHLISLGRELTKMHEEVMTCSLQEALAHFEALDKVRGEFVLTLAPASQDDALLSGESLEAEIRTLLDAKHRTKKIRDLLSTRTALSSSDLYELIEHIKRQPV